VTAAILLAATSCQAAGKLKVGDKAPSWSGIVGVDDKQHSLSDYKDAKAIVLVFTCNHCPVAKAYEDRLIQLQNDYKGKGVQLIAVNVNNIEADRLDKMKVRAEEKGFTFPYLYDSSQKMGVDYGATVTPHVFILDQDRNVAYIGSVDDSQKPEKVTQHYVRDALDALLKGEKPKTAETLAFGCTIKYESP
jgi:peroxiredoxin